MHANWVLCCWPLSPIVDGPVPFASIRRKHIQRTLFRPEGYTEQSIAQAAQRAVGKLWLLNRQLVHLSGVQQYSSCQAGEGQRREVCSFTMEKTPNWTEPRETKRIKPRIECKTKDFLCINRPESCCFIFVADHGPLSVLRVSTTPQNSLFFGIVHNYTKPCSTPVQLKRSQCISYLLLTIVKSDRNSFCLTHVVVVVVMCVLCLYCPLAFLLLFVLHFSVRGKWHC